MAETIGTAYLNIEVRTDNMQAGLSTAKRSVSDMSAAAQAEFNKLSAAQNRAADSVKQAAGATEDAARRQVAALDQVASATSKAAGATKTWSQFVKEGMGPLMRQFSAEGATHAEAHTKAIRQLGEEWRRYKTELKGTVGAQSHAAAGMSSATERLTASQSRLLESLKRTAVQITEGKTAWLEMRAAQLGVSDVAAPYIAKLKTAEQAQTRVGLSARETAFALRGVPAQLTDIFVSLQGGQNPMTVLLQQGGQLRDMFGGVGNAAKALGGSLLGLINPYTVLAASAAVLFLGWEKGQSEAEAFNRALIMNGNYAGMTAGQLALLSAQMDQLAGVTTGSAAAALAAVAQSGQFTGEQIRLVATAAEEMRVATGKSIDETIGEFEKLRKDPVAAILDLNDKYHFLTRAQLDHIEKLKEEGREQEAVTAAMRVYADVIADRAPKIVENLNWIGRTWANLKSIAREVGDEIANIGRASTPQSIAQRSIASQISGLRSLEDNIRRGIANGRTFTKEQVDAYYREIQQRQTAIRAQQAILDANRPKAAARAAAVDSGKERARIKAEEEAEQRWASTVQSNLSKQARLAAEIKQIRADGLALGKKDAEIEAQVAQARARYAESLPKGRKRATPSDPTDSIEARIRQQIALNEAEAVGTDKLTTAERLRVTVLQELDRLGSKVTAARRAEITSLLDQAEASEMVAKKAESERKAKEELLRLTNALTLAERNRSQANADAVAAVGLGQRQVEMMRRRLDIEREYEEGVRQLRDKGVAEGSDSYRAQEAALRATRDRMLAAEEGFWQAMDAARADWANGARAALEDYATAAKDVAGQTYDLFSGAMQGLENVLTDFFTKGKADWKSFADSIAADFTRMIIRQQLARLAEKFIPGMGGGDQAQALAASAGQLAASGGILLSAAGALTASASALAAAGAMKGASGSSGSGSLSGFGNLIGAFMSIAGGRASIAGGRANGGPVFRGAMYEVGELNRPELLHVRGRQYLIPGNQGRVEPIKDSGVRAVSLSQTFVVQGAPDRQTRAQMARQSGREAARAMARTGR